jgi:hypothetical protein
MLHDGFHHTSVSYFERLASKAGLTSRGRGTRA